MKLTHLISLLLLLIPAWMPAEASGVGKDTERLLDRLDSVLKIQGKLVEQKNTRIATLRSNLGDTRSDVEKLGVARRLFTEYSVYDSDSALYYASMAGKLAQRTSPDDRDLIADCEMDEAMIYVVLGLYDKAMELMKRVDSSRLSPALRSRYFEMMAYAHSMRSIYLHSNREIWRAEIDMANTYRDSIAKSGLPLTDEWLWVPIAIAADSKNSNITDIDVSILQRVVDANSEPSRKNAINAYWLSKYYEMNGDQDRRLKYLTMAATYDAEIVNREMAAIPELANILFEEGQVNRAYNYLMFADRQANLYHNRYRLMNLADVLPKVRDAYNAEIAKRDRRLSIYVVILAVLAVILIVSVVLVLVEMKKVKKTRELLSRTNDTLNATVKKRDEAIDSLEKANKELEETNCKLSEANKQKLGLLAYSFKLTSDYIHALEDYRKKLLKKYKIKKIDDLGVLINDPELIKEQYNDFYEGFDSMIFSIFPDFIAEYNAESSEEHRVDPKSVEKSGGLNTRLRIYALRRLGMTKSQDVAAMLNLSIRTVYNNK